MYCPYCNSTTAKEWCVCRKMPEGTGTVEELSDSKPLCKNCKYLSPGKYPPPGPSIGSCSKISQQYGDDTAWSEIGNQFLSIWVGPDFACIKFAKPLT